MGQQQEQGALLKKGQVISWEKIALKEGSTSKNKPGKRSRKRGILGDDVLPGKVVSLKHPNASNPYRISSLVESVKETSPGVFSIETETSFCTATVNTPRSAYIH